jgi:dTDP-4-dehydrorhamnose 3,5-epimerase
MGFARRETALAGLAILERTVHGDNRGQFRRLFCGEELARLGWDAGVAQVNWSLTRRAGSVRGIHFQHPPHAEVKLVACVSGRIWDVAVDLRRGSPTFLRWHAEVLDAAGGRSLLIPKGFGHGFQSLTDDAALVYVHSAAYAPEAEGGVHPADSRVGIAWPCPIVELSAKDAARPFLPISFEGIAA